MLEVESEAVRGKYALSPEENLETLLSFAAFERGLTTLKLDLFDDMRNLLLGRDNQTTCVWNACDPYTTAAVRGVEGNGQRSNCGRTNKDGVDFTKSDGEGFERYIALYHTPQEDGGCKGCRYFAMCKGQCPGTAIDGDWRNRSEHCALWKQLYREIEEQLIEEHELPISVSPIRAEVERAFIQAWTSGHNTSIQNILSSAGGTSATTGSAYGSEHGDAPHGDSNHGDSGHGDAPHGDAPHGDSGNAGPAGSFGETVDLQPMPVGVN